MATFEYIPAGGGEPGRWVVDNPDMEAMEEMIFVAPAYTYYNFVVTGKPTRISPEWIAKHPGYGQGVHYDYAVSYSIHNDDLGDMLDNNDDVVDMFNYYLEQTGKKWIDIYKVELVDRKDPWESA